VIFLGIAESLFAFKTDIPGAQRDLQSPSAPAIRDVVIVVQNTGLAWFTEWSDERPKAKLPSNSGEKAMPLPGVSPTSVLPPSDNSQLSAIPVDLFFQSC
jgi:hypothetical protein